MRELGTSTANPLGKVIAALILTLGIGAAAYAWHRNATHPMTDDATIDAEVIHVAASVGGRVISIAVEENGRVGKGDVLFQIDPLPYEMAVDQAQADLALAEGELDSRQRVLSTEKSNASIARQQTERAKFNGALAARTVERLAPLAGQGYVPEQQLDQAQVAAADADTSLRQAREQQSAAQRAVGTLAGALAAVKARQAALAIARRALSDTTVRATRDGRVAGLSVLPGEVVLPSQVLFTLIATDEWHAVANFRETDLKAISAGACVTAYSLIDRRRPIKGIVESVGWGVFDEERINLPRSVPYVERSLNWVRVAQRFPVRIKLADAPADLMRMGASAVVEINYGPACR